MACPPQWRCGRDRRGPSAPRRREVHGVELGERSAGAEGVHDLHGLHVLDLHSPAMGMPRAVSRLLPRMIELIASSLAGLPAAAIEVRERTQSVGSPGGRVQGRFVRRAPIRADNRAGCPLWRRNGPRGAISSSGMASRRAASSSTSINLDVSTERGALARQIGIDVEHAAVIVAHHAQPVVLHDAGGMRRGGPFIDLLPRRIVGLQRPVT